jgi:hypothetical protein
MPLFMIEFGYTPEVWAGLVKSAENREETVGRMLEDAGRSSTTSGTRSARTTLRD